MYPLYLSSGLFLCAFVCLCVWFSKKILPNRNSRSLSPSHERACNLCSCLPACMRSDGHRTCGTLRAQHSSRRRRHQLLVFFSQSRFPPPDSPPAPPLPSPLLLLTSGPLPSTFCILPPSASLTRSTPRTRAVRTRDLCPQCSYGQARGLPVCHSYLLTRGVMRLPRRSTPAGVPLHPEGGTGLPLHHHRHHR